MILRNRLRVVLVLALVLAFVLPPSLDLRRRFVADLLLGMKFKEGHEVLHVPVVDGEGALVVLVAIVADLIDLLLCKYSLSYELLSILNVFKIIMKYLRVCVLALALDKVLGEHVGQDGLLDLDRVLDV